jgi:hypothetical protein
MARRETEEIRSGVKIGGERWEREREGRGEEGREGKASIERSE